MTSARSGAGTPVFEDVFHGDELNQAVWLPHYLPAWSSREASHATYRMLNPGLELSLPPGTGWFLPETHSPLRVSGLQSGNWSGPAGGDRGQQPPTPGALVREEQAPHRGWLPVGGRLEMRARFDLSPRSMAAWWLVGFEQDPAESAEICVAEIFGDAVVPGESAAVGMGLHPFRDPRVVDDFDSPRLPIDITDDHTYAVQWTIDQVEFFVDGTAVRRCGAPPWYPMQSMIAVFDFPDRSRGGDDDHVPRMVIDRVSGWAA